ncbi:MAG: peptidoglycan-binding protein, partial [Acidobacteriota bacterium]|nr:peptidoglycan-binding protein [Acidobacteriota bacterium]
QRHPNLLVQVAPGLRSSAAGRYQFLDSTWRGLGLKDFSPRSQDLGAIKLMQRRGMIEPLLRGDFAAAIHKGAPEWASLPTASGGSYYGQGAKSLSSLQSVYSTALKHYQNTAPDSPTNPSPNPPTPTAPSKTLVRGNHGHAVEVLQDRLIKLGTMTAAQKNTGAGIFGPRTERAVKSFQRSVGIKADGRYSTATTDAMNRIFDGKIKFGAQNRTVHHIQSKLVQLGFMTRAQVNTGPGIFGPRTDRAVKNFQTKHHLKADGIVNAKTFSAVLQAKPPRRQPSPTGGKVPTYKRWNVYSTGNSPARQADGYEDLQPHHGPDPTTTNYVMRGLTLNHNLQKRDIVLTRPGQSNSGQPVPSPIKGRVLYAGDEKDGYGNKVVVKDFTTGQVTMVGHLASVSVSRGQHVGYGQKLGGQGSTGNSTGAHIHINADPSVIKRWVADLADGKFDGVRQRFDVGRRA